MGYNFQTSIRIFRISANYYGIFLTSYQQHKDENSGQNMKKGIITLLISSVGYVGYVVITRWFDISGWTRFYLKQLGW